ncbi:hypothetical protein ACIF8W_11020 [Streptomyces sp. NPDC085639]
MSRRCPRGTDYLDLRDALAGHEVCALGTEQVGQTGPDAAGTSGSV